MCTNKNGKSKIKDCHLIHPHGLSNQNVNLHIIIYIYIMLKIFNPTNIYIYGYMATGLNINIT